MTGGMTFLRGWLTSVLGVLLVVVPGRGAQAQPAGPLSDVWTQVEVGEKVRVLHRDGSEIRGTLSAIEPTTLAVDVDDRVLRIAAADVREVGVKDGVYNGLLIGMGAGFGAGLLTAMLATSPDDGNLRGLVVMLGGAAGLGIGLGVGAALDAASAQYKIVYRAPTTVRIAPFAAPGAYGASVAVVW